jgi:tetratricopeptide (TPR) repeat protein
MSFFPSCTSNPATAEEYYELGMAFYNVGKFDEAARWLSKARWADKTKNATEYNLGRIAFAQGKYSEAIKHFKKVLAIDPKNVMGMKALAYSYIKAKDYDKAEAEYNQVLQREPASVDAGYNYALVLMALNKPDKAAEVLKRYKAVLPDNPNALLLLARAEKATGDIEAANAYSQWLDGNSDNEVLYEYAQVLEQGSFYARALEQYKKLLKALPEGKAAPPPPKEKGAIPAAPSRGEAHFRMARLLLIADPDKDDGITELEGAVKDGFYDTDKLKSLLDETAITKDHKDKIKSIIKEAAEAKQAADAAAEKAKQTAAEKAQEDAQAAARKKAAEEKAAADKAAGLTTETETTTDTGTAAQTGTDANAVNKNAAGGDSSSTSGTAETTGTDSTK